MVLITKKKKHGIKIVVLGSTPIFASLIYYSHVGPCYENLCSPANEGVS